jgi:methylmalonyl-CoA/ethylmalonyl-CoA epimerase
MRLHHTGVVVRDIKRAAGDFVSLWGYRFASGIIHDPLQTAHVQFLSLGDDRPFLELVAPDGPGSKLSVSAKERQGPHHLCYAVSDIEGMCDRLRDYGLFLIQEPVPAVAFPGRRIAWLMDRNRVLTELVEEGQDDWEIPS